MRPRSKGMAYLVVTVIVAILVIAIAYGLSHVTRTFNMGYAGLLIRTGLNAIPLALLVWYVVRTLRKRAFNTFSDNVLAWGGVVAIVILSYFVSGTARDLFTPPVTRDVEVYFIKARSRIFRNSIYIVAKPLDGNGTEERFYTTRFESIEGVPRYSRLDLPQGYYKMRITYYPHSRTRVSTELIGDGLKK